MRKNSIEKKAGIILMAMVILFTGTFTFSTNAHAKVSSSDRTAGNYYCRVQAYATGNSTGGSYYVGYLQNNSSTFNWMFGTWGFTAGSDITCGTSVSVNIHGPSCGQNYDYNVWSYLSVTQLDVFQNPLHAAVYNN